ncbi:MAG: hypothetical protein V2A61_00805 [Calditrichota bacterium]
MIDGILIEGPSLARTNDCEPILHALPNWFGIEEAIQCYLKKIDLLPTFVAFAGTKPIGFLTLEQFGEHSAEMVVMGYIRNIIGGESAGGWSKRRRNTSWQRVWNFFKPRPLAIRILTCSMPRQEHSTIPLDSENSRSSRVYGGKKAPAFN